MPGPTTRPSGLEHGATAARKRKGTLAMIGKGITFDSGGLSIKPAGSMPEMKHDMSGAAAVFGAMRAIALLDLPIHYLPEAFNPLRYPSGDLPEEALAPFRCEICTAGNLYAYRAAVFARLGSTAPWDSAPSATGFF